MSYPYQIKSIDAYHAAYKKSIEEPAAFWTEIAEHFTWHKKWDTALNWNFKEPKINWFKKCLIDELKNKILKAEQKKHQHRQKIKIHSAFSRYLLRRSSK